MIKILSWNIQQGGGSRVSGVLKFLEEQKAQIIVLSEFRNNKNGIYIRNKLLNLHYRFQLVADCKSEINSVLIASQIPASSQLFFNCGLEFGHGVICAEFDAFKLFGVYLPHKKKHKLFDLLLDEIKAEKPSIIAGDFNTGKNFIDQKGDSFWYTDELSTLEENGMKDAFRHIHGDAKVYSWYSHQGNGYRYDHSYVHQDLLPVVSECDYLPTAREEKLSDHSPMVLGLG